MTAPANPDIYNPRKIFDHPDFKVLADGEKPAEGANIAAFDNPNHQIQKPHPKPGSGQVLLHIRVTGICGCALSSLPLSDIAQFFDRSDVHFWEHGAIGPMIVTDEAR
jgi:L-iditol 2-dehydrogenase